MYIYTYSYGFDQQVSKILMIPEAGGLVVAKVWGLRGAIMGFEFSKGCASICVSF